MKAYEISYEVDCGDYYEVDTMIIRANNAPDAEKVFKGSFPEFDIVKIIGNVDY